MTRHCFRHTPHRGGEQFCCGCSVELTDATAGQACTGTPDPHHDRDHAVVRALRLIVRHPVQSAQVAASAGAGAGLVWVLITSTSGAAPMAVLLVLAVVAGLAAGRRSRLRTRFRPEGRFVRTPDPIVIPQPRASSEDGWIAQRLEGPL